MTAQDTGPLDWRIAIVDKTGRPTPEFQRRWSIQRNNNALIGSVTFGSGKPTGTPDDGAEYVDTSATPYTFYIGKDGSWHQAGTAIFTDLQDAPHSYSGDADKIVRVTSTADGVEFASLSAVLDVLSSTQGVVLYRDSSGWAALAPGTSGQVFTSQGSGANPKWAAGGGGGGGTSLTILQLTTNQAVPTTTFWPISWDTTPIQDDVSAFSAGSPTQVTTPSSGVSLVRFTFNTVWDVSLNGIRYMFMFKNGTELFRTNVAASDTTAQVLHTPYQKTVGGDVWSAQTYQDSGSTRNLIPVTDVIQFQAEWR